jgi:hypothetical protein
VQAAGAGKTQSVDYECDLLHMEQTNLATFYSRNIRRRETK